MAKKLRWGHFSTDDLVVNEQDDIYESFPFLNLVGMLMVKLNELRVGDNAVRSTKDTINQKLVGLLGSLFYGWDRTSWPIPFFRLNSLSNTLQDKEAFDRRHTIKVCNDLDQHNVTIDEVPGAEYERAYPSNGGIINDFLDSSILTMAAMWGNVYGPIVEDTKNHNFVTACYRIIKDEIKRSELEPDDPNYFEHDPKHLINREFIKTLLTHMGCYSRYADNGEPERIITKVLESYRNKNEKSVVGQLTINNNQSDVDKFINDSDDWMHHNEFNDDYIFVQIPIQDHAGFCETYGDRLLKMVCKNEKNHKDKITKVLLYNKENATNPRKIVSSRIKYVERLNATWSLRRNNVLEPVGQFLNEKIIPRKKLSDLKLEIWQMHQLDDEMEPLEVSFDQEETTI